MNRSLLPRDRRHRAMHVFADRGCPVLPLAPGSNKPMRSCPQCHVESPDYVRHTGINDCPHPPDTCHGFHAATVDHNRVQSWIDRWPDLNYGIATGPARLCIVDLDRNKNNLPVPEAYDLPGVTDGLDVFALALERYGAPYPADAMHVRTRNGGLHLWFSLPPGVTVNGSAGVFGWLIDVRAAGNYITGPGTVVQGGEYRRIGHSTSPLPAPAWMLHHLEGTGHMPKPPTPRRPVRRLVPRQDNGQRGKTLQQLADELAAAPESIRHSELCRVTTAAAHMVYAGRITEHDMRDEIYAAGRAAARDEYEINKAIETALAKAARGGAA